MIDVSFTRGHISITGHAGYAPSGQDIVCAAVSTLTNTFLQAIEELTEDNIQYDISPGTVDIKHGRLSTKAKTLKDAFFIGCQTIADEYPYNVQIVQAL